MHLTIYAIKIKKSVVLVSISLLTKNYITLLKRLNKDTLKGKNPNTMPFSFASLIAADVVAPMKS